MPSLVTHALSAMEATSAMQQGMVKRAIDQYPEAFSIGSSGPDFLFFYKVFPIGKRVGQKEMTALGNSYHHNSINDVFAMALTIAKNATFNQAETLSYLAGWFCHYALDRVAHPYVFYHTGFGSTQTSNDHRRMEGMLDTLILKEKRQTDITKFKPYDVVKRTPTLAAVMTSFYAPISDAIFGMEINQEMVLRSLKDMWRLYRVLHDPRGWKFDLIQRFEPLPYDYTGTLIKKVPDEDDQRYDVWNQAHQPWNHPCDITLEYSSSFLDLFTEGTKDATKFLNLMQEFLMDDAAMATILLEIDNRTYDTGMRSDIDMKFYQSIYRYT